MKKILFFILVLVCSVNIIFSQGVQTFSANPNATIVRDASYKIFNLNVTTSPAKTAMNSTWGLYRVKLNISHQSKFNLSIRLVSPSGTIIQLFTRPGSPPTYENFVDTYFRDDAPMTLATFLIPISTYRHNTPAGWIPENSLTSTINTGLTGTPDGTWSLRISDGGGFYTGTLISWELEFRDTPNGNLTTSAWVTNNETGYPSYNDCATPKKLDKYYNYYGRTRLTYNENSVTDPTPAIASSPWRLSGIDANGTIDNTIWYSFKTDATGGNVNVFISMINKYSGASTGYQAVVLDPGAVACVAANWTRVSGTAFLGEANTMGPNPAPLAGPLAGVIMLSNCELKCTGLTANKIYYVCIDGVSSTSGNATSDVDFQIEAVGAIIPDFTILPIELLYFKGNTNPTNNILTWATGTEINNDHFELEKSNDGINFKMIATIKTLANKGNSNSQLNYQFSDELGNAYYRLKQVDIDKTFKYFDIVYIDNDIETTQPIVFPNPATDKLVVNYYTKNNTTTTLSLYDVSGREVLNQKTVFNTDTRETTLNIDALAKGLYFLSISNGYKTFQQKIVKD